MRPLAGSFCVSELTLFAALKGAPFANSLYFRLMTVILDLIARIYGQGMVSGWL